MQALALCLRAAGRREEHREALELAEVEVLVTAGLEKLNADELGEKVDLLGLEKVEHFISFYNLDGLIADHDLLGFLVQDCNQLFKVDAGKSQHELLIYAQIEQEQSLVPLVSSFRLGVHNSGEFFSALAATAEGHHAGHRLHSPFII